MLGALSGPHARFALVNGQVLRYPADVAPFFALPREPSPEDWRDAVDLVPPGTVAAIVDGSSTLPDTWRTVREFDVVQMIEEDVDGGEAAEATVLSAPDVPEMLELVRQTEPGPFLSRTIELGEYVGVRRDGRLVAMAGERLHLKGWTEISAVCTAPSHRGLGLATGLMCVLTAGIHARSERAFLHVLTTNKNAIRLYEELGFRIRRGATISVVMPEPDR